MRLFEVGSRSATSLKRYLAARKRSLFRAMVAELRSSKHTKPKPHSERAAAYVTLAFGLTSVCFVAYLGALVSVANDDLGLIRPALSMALSWSLPCMGALLLVEYNRRGKTNLTPATHRFFSIVAQVVLVADILLAAHVVSSITVAVKERDFSKSPDIMAATKRQQCEAERLKEVEKAADEINEARKGVEQCSQRVDDRHFSVRLSLERGDITSEKALELRRVALKMCDPYLRALDESKLHMEVVFSRNCKRDPSSQAD